MLRQTMCLAIVQALSTIALAAAAESPFAPRAVDAEGLVHLQNGNIPLSSFMSEDARRAFIKQFCNSETQPQPDADIRLLRDFDERQNAPFVARARMLYPVIIEPKVIGGVGTEIISPKAGVSRKNRQRVLINLHGGAFLWGEGNGAEAESIPIAAVGQITVVTVAYRLAPEFKFPAASKDVAAVYRELLKRHRSADIGIYGCSAGGILTAEAIAWFQKEQLPMPGAIGTFCGSADAFGGDSAYLSPLLVGEPPMSSGDVGTLHFTPYFEGASISDPLVLPINSKQVLARFPPTLLIAGSRDFAVSSLYHVHAVLTDVGVEAELHVWDGMWHAFFMDPDLPESKQAYRVIATFFDRQLGRRRGHRG